MGVKTVNECLFSDTQRVIQNTEKLMWKGIYNCHSVTLADFKGIVLTNGATHASVEMLKFFADIDTNMLSG